ncbi:MAG: hypothetical protein ACRCTQ_04440 [Brevinemataceae bacterium]
MKKIIYAFLLTVLMLTAGILIIRPHNTAIWISEMFILIAATCFFVISASKINSFYFIPTLFGYIYLLLICIMNFGIRESMFLIGQQNTPSATAVSLDAPMHAVMKELSCILSMPNKKGIITTTSEQDFAFGITAQLNPLSYIISNVVISSSDSNQQIYTYYAPIGKIENNTLALYNYSKWQEKNGKFTNISENKGIETFPLPFDMKILYHSWNNPKFQTIPVLLNINVLSEAKLPLLFRTAQYLIDILLILFIGGISLRYQNVLIFKGINLLGSITAVVLSFPCIIFIHEYLILAVYNIINLMIGGIL